jgi:xylan 1,4-beta-xylosidase
MAATLPAGEVTLRMEMAPPPTGFSPDAMGGDRIRLLVVAGQDEVLLAELDGRDWTAETTASFTGRVIGLYASEGVVTFADYSYSGTDRPRNDRTRPGGVRDPGTATRRGSTRRCW